MSKRVSGEGWWWFFAGVVVVNDDDDIHENSSLWYPELSVIGWARKSILLHQQQEQS